MKKIKNQKSSSLSTKTMNNDLEHLKQKIDFVELEERLEMVNFSATAIDFQACVPINM